MNPLAPFQGNPDARYMYTPSGNFPPTKTTVKQVNNASSEASIELSGNCRLERTTVLTRLQREIAEFEAMRQDDPDSSIEVKTFCELHNISKVTYHNHTKRPEVAHAVANIIKQLKSANTSMTDVLMHRRALYILYGIVTDPMQAGSNQQINALKELLARTDTQDNAVYTVPYEELTDEELLDIAVARQDRLELHRDEIDEIIAEQAE